MTRPRPKSRRTAEKTRVTVHIPELDDDRDAQAPGHNGGHFADAGYRAGTGMFGFAQDVVQS